MAPLSTVSVDSRRWPSGCPRPTCAHSRPQLRTHVLRTQPSPRSENSNRVDEQDFVAASATMWWTDGFGSRFLGDGSMRGIWSDESIKPYSADRPCRRVCASGDCLQGQCWRSRHFRAVRTDGGSSELFLPRLSRNRYSSSAHSDRYASRQSSNSICAGRLCRSVPVRSQRVAVSGSFRQFPTGTVSVAYKRIRVPEARDMVSR
jgi:hypothetical protein